VKIRFL